MHKRIYHLLIIFILLLSACAKANPESQETTDLQQLRISNVGDTNIQNLTIVVPGTTTAVLTRINFGNIDSGQITEYKPIPGGVYRFSAYEYTLDGETVFQEVMDLVGEKPLPGTQFTYEIVLDETKVKGDQVQLVNVLTDH